jgi:hypothetical protein
LTNDELALLFRKRAADVADNLDGHSMWESKYTVYWTQFTALQDKLYEVMMEIQSRYPRSDVREYHRTLPVMEPRQLPT